MYDESASKSHPLPHATRKFARICTLEAIKADKVNRRQRARAHLLLRQAECFESKLDVLEHRQPRKQRKALEDHGNAGRAALNPAAQVSDRAGDRSRETSNQTKEGGLSRPRAPEQANDLPFPQFQIDLIEDDQFPAASLRERLAHAINLEELRARHGKFL